MELTYVEVTILDWQRYRRPNNPNQKHYYWFKFPNDMLSQAPFSHLTGDELKTWIGILSLCSERNGSALRLCYEQFSSRFRVKQVTIRNALRKLQAFEIIEVGKTDTTKAAHHENRIEKKRKEQTGDFSLVEENKNGWQGGLRNVLQEYGVTSLTDAVAKTKGDVSPATKQHLYKGEE